MHKLLRTITIVLASLGLAAPIFLAGSSAGAAGLTDLTTSIVSKPAVVSPPGAKVIYAVHVQNAGLPASGHVDVTMPSGFGYADALSSSTCDAVSSTVVRCTFGTLNDAQGADFEVVAATPVSTSTQTYTVSADVAADVLLFGVVEDASNNHAQTTTQVKTVTSGVFSGYIPAGGNATLTVGDASYTVYAPAQSNGVIVDELRQFNASSKTCVDGTYTGPCGTGFLIRYLNDGIHEVTDRTHPIKTVKNFGISDPCRGIGNPSCSRIFFSKDPSAPTATLEPACLTDGQANPGAIALCNDDTTKVGSTWQYTGNMLSTDPLEIPPLVGKISG